MKRSSVCRIPYCWPSVFSGISEFSIHKEFVSSKVAGEAANGPGWIDNRN